MDSLTERLPKPAVSTTTLIAGLGIVQIIGWGGLVHMFSAYIKPMQDEFGWSSAEITGALTVGLFMGDIVSIPVGHWLDRRGGYVIMTFGAILGSVMIAVWSLISDLWQLYAVWTLMGVALGTTLGNNCPAVITANVPDYRKGLNYIAFLSGLAASVAIPSASLLIAHFGWREALGVCGLAQFFGNACICAYVLRGTVGSRHTPRGAPPDPHEPSPLKQAIKRRAFWTLSVACAIHWFVSSCMTVHMLPLLQERGLGMDQSLSIIALTGPAAVVSRILLFYSNFGASAWRTGRVVFPLMVVGLLILIGSSLVGYWGIVLYTIVFGMANGIVVIVRQTVIAEIFGIRGFGAISGAITTVSILPRTLSPLAVSALHDWLGGYNAVLWILIGIMVVSTAAFYVATAEQGKKA